ncbi:hypothetical protein AKJ52_01620 [candidate division MSBL1 archaeon SCGC-AAA382C18]|uniref:Aldehyde oxidase/xanthine dehydrogenase a/b hammerhead domain-containing protein n=1 Tax=candidate division MSBL1 archaeon SCGC-AAA382C18 TaxID=1698281 RepID=A0A133VJZ6_9EURY|nr:hypothetical protein AKJ52_01620 [candidate division MSBL1 archaeon SCGC-AAA382C18]
MSDEYSYVGKSPERLDSVEKVTGEATYTQDIELPGMLYAKFKKSSRAHARIVEIDTKEAEELEGVRTVITGEDVPFKFGKYIEDRNVLAREKTRYIGEPVAAVAADSRETAEEAVKLINVEYEDLEPVFDATEAIEDDAPLIHEDISGYDNAPFIYPKENSNVANHFKLRKGDVEEGFEEADEIVENTFYQPQTQHVEMETHTTVATWTTDDNLKVWTSAQAPFVVRENLNHMFDIPIKDIDVQVPYLGGGFGGKAGINWEPLSIILSREAGHKPVKVELTREEQFKSSSVRTGLWARIKTGVKEDGEITAMEVEYIWDPGAYADYAVNVGRASGYATPGPYEVDNIKTDSYTVYTNRPYGTAFRGFGHVPFHWATERQMNLVAEEIGMDPYDFRMKNAMLPGDVSPTGVKMEDKLGRMDECMEAVKDELNEECEETEEGKLYGTGLAVFWKAPAMPANTSSSAIVKINQDGTVTLSVSTSQMGQGTVTSLAQMVAEELDVPYEKIEVPNHADTDLSVYTWQTVGSRSTFMDGNAVLEAAKDAKRQLKEIASELLDVPKDRLVVKDEKVSEKEGDKGVSLSEIALGGTYPSGGGFGGPVTGYGVYTAEGLSNLDPDTGEGEPGLFWTTGARGAEIEIDPETGAIDIKRIISSFDAGKEINPELVDGQIYGGVVQHIGSTLSEEYIYDDEGNMLNNNLTDYKIPRSTDIPEEFVNIIKENAQENAPFGARGVGELAMISVAPAIANAIYDATGVNMYDLPLSRDNLSNKVCGVESMESEED